METKPTLPWCELGRAQSGWGCEDALSEPLPWIAQSEPAPPQLCVAQTGGFPAVNPRVRGGA